MKLKDCLKQFEKSPNEETLKQITKQVSGKLFSLFYNATFDTNKDLFISIFSKLNVNDRTLLFNYLKENVNKCPECGNFCIKPRVFCSQTCSRTSIITKNKRQATNLKRYGVLNANNPEKQKETNLRKYGTDFPTRLESVKEKTRKTNLERYGAEYHTQTKEWKIKNKKTLIERYGVENCNQLESSVIKAKQTKLERYGDANYNNLNKQKETLLKKYGVDNISKSSKNKTKIQIAHAKKFKIDDYFYIKYP